MTSDQQGVGKHTSGRTGVLFPVCSLRAACSSTIVLVSGCACCKQRSGDADPCLNHTQRQAVKRPPWIVTINTRPSRLDGTQSDSRKTLFRALEQDVSCWNRQADC